MPFDTRLASLQGQVTRLRLLLQTQPPFGFVGLLGQRFDHETVRRLLRFSNKIQIYLSFQQA
jgi:hypothetical protein